MANNPQILTLGKMLYRHGLGMSSCSRYSKLAVALSDKQLSQILSEIIKNGIKSFDFGDDDGNDNVWTDWLGKCPFCSKPYEPINHVDSCSC